MAIHLSLNKIKIATDGNRKKRQLQTRKLFVG
ncbi:MAG: hypothetical protein RL372_305 [Bacteroidota bacterium]|jgi:hypothetical protein